MKMLCARAEICLYSDDGEHCPDPKAGRLHHESDCHNMSVKRQEEMLEEDDD